MYYVVYQTTNLIDGKIYVGAHKTSNLLDGYMGSGIRIRRAIEKHGKDNFKTEILYHLSNSEEMYAKEAEIVNEEFVARDDTYNIKLGGWGGWDHCPSAGRTLSDKARMNIRLGALRRDKSPYQGTKSDAHRAAIKEYHADFSDGNHPRARSISIDGIIYDTQRLAAKAMKVVPNTVQNRVSSDKWPTWKYV